MLGPLAFVGAGWVILFSGWQTYTTLMLAMLIGYALIGINYRAKMNPKAVAMDWAAAPWIIAWLVGMGVISYLSDFGPGGDHRRHRDLQERPRSGRHRCHRPVGRDRRLGGVQPDHLLLGDLAPAAGVQGRRVRPRRLSAARSPE